MYFSKFLSPLKISHMPRYANNHRLALFYFRQQTKSILVIDLQLLICLHNKCPTTTTWEVFGQTCRLVNGSLRSRFRMEPLSLHAACRPTSVLAAAASAAAAAAVRISRREREGCEIARKQKTASDVDTMQQRQVRRRRSKQTDTRQRQFNSSKVSFSNRSVDVYITAVLHDPIKCRLHDDYVFVVFAKIYILIGGICSRSTIHSLIFFSYVFLLFIFITSAKEIMLLPLSVCY